METPRSTTIEGTTYSMLYDSELLSDSRLIKNSLFHTFSVTVEIRDNFLGFNFKLTHGTYKAKVNNKSHAEIRTKESCIQKFKKLQILTVTS